MKATAILYFAAGCLLTSHESHGGLVAGFTRTGEKFNRPSTGRVPDITGVVGGQ